ncbi:hypothetical protein [Rhodococcus daqingensis]|uniref:Uncharacterized protein n=1 Tax=Rhodococcus daqingensis TaxID=2479363 RepID=A0ABW2RTW6_9NOCA
MRESDTPPTEQPRTASSRRFVAGLATTTVAVALAAIGPGVAIASAALTRNHNEVMATARR